MYFEILFSIQCNLLKLAIFFFTKIIIDYFLVHKNSLSIKNKVISLDNFSSVEKKAQLTFRLTQYY